MKEVEPYKNQGDLCPKRLWVMTTLSDDVQFDGGEEPSRGLQLHLSRCASCRALAERMLSVTKSIRELGDLEPAEDLARRADEQVTAALQEGARLTGRVEIPEIEDVEPAVSRRGGWRVFLPYAAAAAVLIAVSAFWVSRSQAPREQLADRLAPQPETLPAVEPKLAKTPPREPIPSNLETAPDERPAEERLVQSEPKKRSPRPSRTVCDFHSHIEAAECEDDLCIHRAVILPDPAQRTIGWRGAFDNESPIESTTPLRNDN